MLHISHSVILSLLSLADDWILLHGQVPDQPHAHNHVQQNSAFLCMAWRCTKRHLTRSLSSSFPFEIACTHQRVVCSNKQQTLVSSFNKDMFTGGALKLSARGGNRRHKLFLACLWLANNKQCKAYSKNSVHFCDGLVENLPCHSFVVLQKLQSKKTNK